MKKRLLEIGNATRHRASRAVEATRDGQRFDSLFEAGLPHGCRSVDDSVPRSELLYLEYLAICCIEIARTNPVGGVLLGQGGFPTTFIKTFGRREVKTVTPKSRGDSGCGRAGGRGVGGWRGAEPVLQAPTDDEAHKAQRAPPQPRGTQSGSLQPSPSVRCPMRSSSTQPPFFAPLFTPCHIALLLTPPLHPHLTSLNPINHGGTSYKASQSSQSPLLAAARLNLLPLVLFPSRRFDEHQ